MGEGPGIKELQDVKRVTWSSVAQGCPDCNVLKHSLESCCQVEWPLAMWLLSTGQVNGKVP